MHLHPGHVLLFLQTLSLCGSLSLPSPTPNGNALSPGSARNLSALPDLPDNDFGIFVTWYEAKLSETACIMVCMVAMRELALYHFDDKELPRQTWFDRHHPEIILIVQPDPGSKSGKISVRFAMWIIASIMQTMLTQNRFRSSSYAGFYKAEPVGAVSFLAIDSSNPSSQRPQDLGPTTTATNKRGISFKSTSMSSAVTLSEYDKLDGNVKYVGNSIARKDIYLVLVWLLVELAPHNREPITVWRATRVAIESEVTTIWNRVKQPSASSRKQMTKGDLISLLAYLPRVLITDNIFREMDLTVSDSEVVVARGAFRAKPLGGGLLSVSSAINITVS